MKLKGGTDMKPRTLRTTLEAFAGHKDIDVDNDKVKRFTEYLWHKGMLMRDVVSGAYSINDYGIKILAKGVLK